jgi:hypothetical protein
LTPEGLQEVLAGLRQLQNEADKSNKRSTGGLTLLKQAALDLKALLPTLGLAATGFAILSVSKHALEAADATGKLQQKVGGTTEEISGLTHAFVTSNSSQEELQGLLFATSRRLDELRSGAPETADAFSRIGLAVEDLKGLDAPRALELIASRLANIPDGATKSALATQLFNKSANELIPALNAVGEQGIEPFIEAARKAGVLVGTDLAQAAARANDAFQNLQIQAEGTASFFLSGFLPPITDALEAFGAAIESEGISPVRALGTALGWLLKSAVFVFTTIGKLIGAQTAAFGAFIRLAVDSGVALATLDFTAAKAAVARFFDETSAIAKGYVQDIADDYEKLATPPAPKERKQTGTVAPAINAIDQRVAQARAAFLKSQLDNELSLQKAHLDQMADANEQAYKAGLISLTEYYRRRRELADKQAAAEIANLRAQRQVLLQNEGAQISELTRQREAVRAQAVGQKPATPAAASTQGASLNADIEARRLKLREQLADLDAKIQVSEVEHARTMQALDAEQVAAQRQLTQEQIQAFNTLDELEGNRHSVFLRNLTVESRELRELLTRAGADQSEIDDQVRRLSAARTSQFDFEEVSRRGRTALDSFNRDAEQIRRDQEAGVIGQVEGEDRLIALEGKRLEVLKAISAQQLEAAQKTGVPELITQAQQYADSVAQIEASFKGATDVVAQFKQQTSEGLREGFRDIFQHIDEIHSLEDAVRSLGDTLLQVFKDFSADIISKQLTRGIESALSIGADAAQGGAGAVTGQAAAAAETTQAAARAAATEAAAASLATAGATVTGGATAVAASATTLSAAGASLNVGAAAISAAAAQLAAAAAAAGAASAGSGVASIAGAAALAEGGLVRGPGTGVSDSILAVAGRGNLLRISNREFVVRNRVVEQPGALQFLREFNARGMPAVHMPRFASGGLVGMAPPANALRTSSSRRDGEPSLAVRIYQTIQAPDRETGRRTATQAAAGAGRAVADAVRRNN